MAHSYPIVEIQHIMQVSEAELQKLLHSTPHKFKSNGILQIFGEKRHIPHIKIQIFLALMRLKNLEDVPYLQFQPYLFALLLLHKKWLEPLREKFYPEECSIDRFSSKYELALYMKMGGGQHWTTLNERDIIALPNDLSGLLNITSCYLSKSFRLSKQRDTFLHTLFWNFGGF